VAALIASSAIRTCLGDGEATFSALLEGSSGIGDLRFVDASRLGVARGYHIDDGGEERLFRASRWLGDCVREALDRSGVATAGRRVVAVVGTGLRELRAVERSAVFDAERLHFSAAVREAAPAIAEVVTLSNACSAGGHALALAQDLVELGQADVAIAAAADSMTESMLAMIGRVADAPSDYLRPFDAGRTGTLLGDGAAAIVVTPEGARDGPAGLARLLSTGLSCDARSETAPDADGIVRAIRDAFERAGRSPLAVDLVLAHGTGTTLNDPLEARLIGSALSADARRPLITAVKGAIGHTSGAAALCSVDVAIRCLRQGVVPAIAGLRSPLAEARGLRLVIGLPVEADLRLAQVNAFGFGGVNSVTLLENAA
jgi:3-oxoacyl-[acyl-carrier-protein] synthase II